MYFYVILNAANEGDGKTFEKEKAIIPKREEGKDERVAGVSFRRYDGEVE